jgi:predicted Zn-dependent peptidase
VREKRGLAYSVHAWTDAYPDTGFFGVQAGVEHGKLEETLTTILAEFRKVKDVAVGKEELLKAKQYLKGTTTLRLETSDAVAEHSASSLINLGRLRDLDEIIKNIDAVTADDVQRVAQDILKTEKLNLAVIGPHVHSAQLLSLLKV